MQQQVCVIVNTTPFPSAFHISPIDSLPAIYAANEDDDDDNDNDDESNKIESNRFVGVSRFRNWRRRFWSRVTVELAETGSDRGSFRYRAVVPKSRRGLQASKVLPSTDAEIVLAPQLVAEASVEVHPLMSHNDSMRLWDDFITISEGRDAKALWSDTDVADIVSLTNQCKSKL